MNTVIPKGKKLEFEDDIVGVFDAVKNCVYYGIFDYCPYKDNFNDYNKWNDIEKLYELQHGYKLVVFRDI